MQDFDLMIAIIRSLRTDGMIAKNYPIVVGPGVPRGWIHSLLISHLVILGHELGYISLADIGIFDRTIRTLTKENTIRRPDPVWMTKNGTNIDLLAEIESSSLVKKTKNLIKLSEHVSESFGGEWPKACCILWWGDLDPAELEEASNLLRKGFTESGTRYRPSADCGFLVLQSIFKKNGDLLSYEGTKTLDVIKRGHTKKKWKSELDDAIRR